MAAPAPAPSPAPSRPPLPLPPLAPAPPPPGGPLARLRDAVRAERALLADFLESLADADRRGVWRALGHPSLVAWLVRDLGLSATAAYQRKVAAELIQRFPEAGDAFRDGRVCLSTVIDVARAAPAAREGALPPRLFRGTAARSSARTPAPPA